MSPVEASMRRCLALVRRQMQLLRGSPARMVSLFVWIGIDMVLWGFMSRYLNTLGPKGYTFVPSLLGGGAAVGTSSSA